jgi:uncharacterized membrane protein
MHLSDLHTVIDRFAIAFVNVGIIFELTASIFKLEAMKQFGWNCLRLGFVFAILAVATGFLSEHLVYLSPDAEKLHNFHKLFSLLLIGLLGVAIGIRMMFQTQFNDKTRGSVLRGSYLAIVVIAFFLSGMTGVLGTQMVYSLGVNVRPYERFLTTMPPPVRTDTTRSPNDPTSPGKGSSDLRSDSVAK